eukprot:449614-Rhodomonas_salina.1
MLLLEERRPTSNTLFQRMIYYTGLEGLIPQWPRLERMPEPVEYGDEEARTLIGELLPYVRHATTTSWERLTGEESNQALADGIAVLVKAG